MKVQGSSLDFPEDSPLFDILKLADRALSGSGFSSQVSDLFGEFLSGVEGPRAEEHDEEPEEPQAPQESKEDPRLVLGFEKDQELTAADVKARKRALAMIYHPDKAGGSARAMKRVNDAADRLLNSL